MIRGSLLCGAKVATLSEAARSLLFDVAVICPHTDADGLSSGALALRARGEGADDALLLGRGQTPFGRGGLRGAPSAAVLDWGIREVEGPCLYVDHHAPEVEPGPDQVAVSGYGASPEVSTSVLVFRLIGEGPSWLAAVGALGDLGDRARSLPELASVPRTAVRQLTTLVNAPRRVPDGPVRDALAVLVESDSPKAALADPRVRQLEDARQQFAAAYRALLRTPPEVSDGVAVIRFSSPYQVHPLLAQTWERRLSPAYVIAANDTYLPGKVNFSMRGGEGNLRALLAGALPGHNDEYARGHDRATGGSLTPEDFDLMIRRLRQSVGSS